MKCKKIIVGVLFVLLLAMPVFSWGDWEWFGQNTEVAFYEEPFNLSDAILMAMLLGASYNPEFYDFTPEVMSKAEFTKLPQNIFGEAITALAKQKYGAAFVSSEVYENILCIRLENGEYLVVTVKETDE